MQFFKEQRSHHALDIMHENGPRRFTEPSTVPTSGHHKSSGGVDYCEANTTSDSGGSEISKLPTYLGNLASVMTSYNLELSRFGPHVFLIVCIPQTDIVMGCTGA